MEEAAEIIRKIKVKNDTLSKMPYDDHRIQQEINKDKAFLQDQVRRFHKIIRGIEQAYLDPDSSRKVETLKGDARKQIKRNEYLIQKLVNDNNPTLNAQGIEMVDTPSHLKEQVYDSEYKLKLVHAQEKSKMIQEFSKSIVQINQIMLETNAMTLEQGEHLDLIGDNIHDTHKNVEVSAKNVSEANLHHKRSKKWVFVLSGTIVAVVVVALIVVLSLR